MENGKLKVLGYVRVSSEKSKLKNNSIKNQELYINEYCKNMSYDLVEIFKDEGISGRSIKNRDGLMDLFSYIKKNNIDCLIVYSISRLSRNLKDVLSFIEFLDKNNVKFISCKENFNSNDVMGKFMIGIMGNLSELESNMIGDRIKDVKRYKKSKKEVYGGKILFGWYRRGNKLVRNVKELEILKLISRLREEENMSYFKISDYLNDNGFNSKEKKKWYGSSVRKIYLDNSFLLEV